MLRANRMKNEKIRGLLGLARRARGVTVGSRETRDRLRRREINGLRRVLDEVIKLPVAIAIRLGHVHELPFATTNGERKAYRLVQYKFTNRFVGRLFPG